MHLLAVDGNSMAHRAWHAIRDGDDAVGAFVLGGMVSLVASVWHHGPFDGLFVAFDDEVNQRKATHPTYKADRQTDEDLRARLRAMPDRLASAGVATATVPGAEADDLLAAVTAEATRRGWRTDVLSGDRDLLPLVDDHVRLLRPRATMSDLVVYDPGRVRAEYGVEPRSYRHLAALRGDPSDGLPGVEGIGAVTAARLLAEHRTLDELYANLCYLPPRDERALRAGRALARGNLDIMTPLPVTIDLDTVAAPDVGRLEELLGALDQGRAVRRLAHALDLARRGPVPPPDGTGDLTTGATAPPDDVPWPDEEPTPDQHVGDQGDDAIASTPWSHVPSPSREPGSSGEPAPADPPGVDPPGVDPPIGPPGDGPPGDGPPGDGPPGDGPSGHGDEPVGERSTVRPGRLVPDLGEQPSLF